MMHKYPSDSPQLIEDEAENDVISSFLPRSLAQGTSCKDPANVGPNQIVDVIKCSGCLHCIWLVTYEISIT